MVQQTDLFALHEAVAGLPSGFRYDPQLMTQPEAALLASQLQPLPFKAFEFHGFTGKRRVVSYGWSYDFSTQQVRKAEDMPAFLLPVRDLAAAFAHIDPQALQQALITEYAPGASIGWHKDKKVFGQVVGLSLGSPCTLRFRRSDTTGAWVRRNLTLEPGSAYLITGESRTAWEHSIPPVERLRYSITFRSMSDGARS